MPRFNWMTGAAGGVGSDFDGGSPADATVTRLRNVNTPTARRRQKGAIFIGDGPVAIRSVKRSGKSPEENPNLDAMTGAGFGRSRQMVTTCAGPWSLERGIGLGRSGTRQ